MANFQPGVSGNPAGRPKGAGGGRTLALANLDKMLARPRNQALLIRALEREFKKDPVRFFRTMIMPLLPKEARLELGHEGVIQWKSLMGGSPVNGGQLTVDSEGKSGQSDPRPIPLPSSTFGLQEGTMADRQGDGIVIDVEAREATP